MRTRYIGLKTKPSRGLFRHLGAGPRALCVLAALSLRLQTGLFINTAFEVAFFMSRLSLLQVTSSNSLPVARQKSPWLTWEQLRYLATIRLRRARNVVDRRFASLEHYTSALETFTTWLLLALEQLEAIV